MHTFRQCDIALLEKKVDGERGANIGESREERAAITGQRERRSESAKEHI